MKFYRVTSDNFQNDILTAEAYKEACLQMSSGDYAMHEAYLIDINLANPNESIYGLTTDYDGRDVIDIIVQANYFQISKVKKSKLAEVKQFNINKQREKTPREKLLANQRKLFNVRAEIIIIDFKQKKRA